MHMLSRRSFLKLGTFGTATIAVLSAAPFFVRGASLRSQIFELDTPPKTLDTRHVSVWEYADLVTVRPSTDPSTWDWTYAVQALLNRGGNIILPEKNTYTVSSTLQIRSNTWLIVNGVLRFADQKNTRSSDHLLMCGGLRDPRENVIISGVGTIDGNYQGRKSFAPTSGAYLLLARETVKLRVADGLKFINAPSSAIAGVTCTDVVVEGVDLRYVCEHGIYFSTGSKRIKILNNTLNDLAISGEYSADAIKLRDNCTDFIIQDNTLNLTPLTAPNVIRGVVLDDSGNVAPVKNTICREGKILGNTMLQLSTGIWFKGALTDAGEADALFDMRVEVAGNVFEAKEDLSLFAAILDRVRKVDLNDNVWRNFNAGIYGGGVGDITLRRNKIVHIRGGAGYGVRMLDALYNDTKISSRARGNVVMVGNEIVGYNGGGVLMSIASAYDELRYNKIISRGRAISYLAYGLSSAPTNGVQHVDLSDNPQLISTGKGMTAVFLNAKSKIPANYRVARNNIASRAIGVAYPPSQNNSATANQINAPIPVSFDY